MEQGSRDLAGAVGTPLDLWRDQADAWQTVAEADSYDRLTPDLINFRSVHERFKRSFLREIARPQVATPPEDLYFLDDCIVSEVGIVYLKSGEPFAPSLIDHDKVYDLAFLAGLSDEPIPELDGLGLFPFKAGKDNYGHVLVEMLPKLENLRDIGLVAPKLIVPRLPETVADGLEPLLAALYPGRFAFHTMRHPLLRVKQLIYPGPISKHSTRKSITLLRFAERLQRLPLPELHQPQRVYVSREGVAKRRMLNEAEIRHAFERRGFSVVHPERLSLLEQVAVFGRAERIAGPLGAGLTNALFAPEQAEVIMLDPGLHDYFFFDLCSLRQQRLTWVFRKPLVPMNLAMLLQDYRFPKRLLPLVL